MRVTTWNCYRGADVAEYLALLEPLDAGLVALQECRRPDGDDASVIWRGVDAVQGTAVASTSDWLRIEPVEIPSLHRTVVPVVVQAPQPFVFVGVWTHPPYNEVAWDAMTACVDAADGLPVVAAGDFNSSPGVRGQELTSARLLQRMRDEFGLVSAYHHLTGEAHGEETRATYYHQWNASNPFHIDYCFVPDSWASRLSDVSVGSYADWPRSDHRPLTVEVDA